MFADEGAALISFGFLFYSLFNAICKTMRRSDAAFERQVRLAVTHLSVKYSEEIVDTWV